MKVYQFAKELGLETIALMDKIKEWDLPIKSHMSSLDEETIEVIKEKLGETGEEKAEKKVAKKKATKKTAKKATVKKTTATKSKKKAAKKSSVTKVSSGKLNVNPGQGEAKPAPKKAKAKRIIRRKANEVEEAKQAELEKMKLEQEEAAAQVKAQKSEQEAESAGANQSPEAENNKDTKTAKPIKKARVFGKSIVGKIDLSKVKDPKRQQGDDRRGSSTGGPGRSTQQRGLRTGFVAAPVPVHIDQDHGGKGRKDADKDDSSNKKKGAGVKEQQPVEFKAAEFRKREMVFQPKKKKVSFMPGKKTEITKPAAHKRVVKVNGTMTVSDLAQTMGVKATEIIKISMSQGLMANLNTELDFDTISLLVSEFEWEAENVETKAIDIVETVAFGDLDAELQLRAPVVTVMGHVDHGKTTLLDSIRSANVAAGEAGGITQHIGAYRVFVEGDKAVTFIDTPGHAAFTEMRARGANATDIVIIVVAADDGMKPQTEEAISHAKAAGVPIIVAINKIDKEGANPDRIKQQLSEKELVPEEWGGDTVFQQVSALKGEGIKELLETLWLHAEILELKANPNRSASGVVIESKVEKGKGIVATLLVQDGTIKVGQSICAGTVTGRVRRMMDDQGKSVQEAGPSVPVEVMGLSASPNAGDRFDICETDQIAAELSETRKLEKQQKEMEDANKKVSLEDLLSKVKSDGAKELPIVLKADVAGSVEAVKGMLSKIDSKEVKVKFVHSAVGGISESDALLASTSGGIVLGFNVRPDSQATKLAKEKGVEIKTYRIIYELVDDVKKAMSGLLDPDVVEKEHGKAEVRDTFSIPKIGMIAGTFVTEGKINRNDMVRLIREGRVVYEGKISSLKRFKDDAKEVASGYECGIGIENYNDIKVGDVIESYVKEEVARELN